MVTSKMRTTVCPKSSDPFYTVTNYINWFTSTWTGGSTLAANPVQPTLRSVSSHWNQGLRLFTTHRGTILVHRTAHLLIMFLSVMSC